MNHVHKLVDAISSGNTAAANKAFKAAVEEKKSAAIDIKKIQLTAQVYNGK